MDLRKANGLRVCPLPKVPNFAVGMRWRFMNSFANFLLLSNWAPLPGR